MRNTTRSKYRVSTILALSLFLTLLSNENVGQSPSTAQLISSILNADGS